ECENLAGEPIRLGGVPQPPVSVLALWATWCDACIIEMPLLAQAHRGIAGGHHAGINVDEDKDAFERYISAHTLPFPMLRDAAGTIQERLGLSVLPVLLVLNQDGLIIETVEGMIPDGEFPMYARRWLTKAAH